MFKPYTPSPEFYKPYKSKRIILPTGQKFSAYITKLNKDELKERKYQQKLKLDFWAGYRTFWKHKPGILYDNPPWKIEEYKKYIRNQIAPKHKLYTSKTSKKFNGGSIKTYTWCKE